MRLLYGFSVTAIVAMCAIAPAQTVTVNKTATANGTTIFNTVGGALEISPDVIEITDSAVYEEIISITSPVQIIGTEEVRPTLALVANPAGGKMSYSTETTFNTGGMVINLPDTMTTGAVKLHNLIILPQKGIAPPDRLRTAIENQNNNLYLELDHVLITANDGNDQPLSPDGIPSLVASFLPGHITHNLAHTPFGANGLHLGRTSISGIPTYEGDGLELLVKDSVITHFRNNYITAEPERFPKCIYMANPYTDNANPDPTIHRLIRIEGESVISHANVGIECSGDLSMSSDGERIVMIGLATQALDFTGPAVSYRNIEDITITNNGANGIWDRGHGPVRFSLKNCASFNSLNSIILVTGTAAGEIVIEDSTLIGGRNHASAGKPSTFEFRNSTTCNITVRNSILGGKLNHSKEPPPPADPSDEAQVKAYNDLLTIWNNNAISLLGTNQLTLEGTALVGTGPFSFRLSETDEFMGFNLSENSSVIGTPSTLADPLFVSTNGSAPLDPNFLDVVNVAYATANATGGPLGGGADYVGESSVSDWSVY